MKIVLQIIPTRYSYIYSRSPRISRTFSGPCSPVCRQPRPRAQFPPTDASIILLETSRTIKLPLRLSRSTRNCAVTSKNKRFPGTYLHVRFSMIFLLLGLLFLFSMSHCSTIASPCYFQASELLLSTPTLPPEKLLGVSPSVL